MFRFWAQITILALLTVPHALCVLPQHRYDGWLMRRYPDDRRNHNWLYGFHPMDDDLSPSELGNLAYQAARQMKKRGIVAGMALTV